MTAFRRMPLSGWGRYPVASCALAEVSAGDEAATLVLHAPQLIPRGRGRSYGDSSLNPTLTAVLSGMDRILAFDQQRGQLCCEAGLVLADLIDLFLPRGWFPPVTPGTKFVTVGGMIAADVHGKNHHKVGSFCDHVDWIELALPDAGVVRCSAHEHADLFAATCGGMGLTGLILRACFRLLPVETASIWQSTRHASDLDTTIALIEDRLDATYSVAWIDCLATGRNLGRSVLFLGEHAGVEALPPERRDRPLQRQRRWRKAVPIDLPSFVLASPSVRLFNATYYRAQREGERLVDVDPYFYPLDAIEDWNRIYGRRGFVQYQCVLPLERSRDGLVSLLETISSAGSGSFLTVLKRMDGQSFGMLSFPMTGYTLALDFPATPENLSLLDRLDDIVGEAAGRLYLAKDARMDAHNFAMGYPRLEEFRNVRQRWGVDERFRSLQSERLRI